MKGFKSIIIGIVAISVPLNGAWRINTIAGGGGDGIDVGQGRNDGANRVYVVSGNSIREYSYTGGNWGFAALPSGGADFGCGDVVVGKGRNDGIYRVYAGGAYGGIVEFTYTGGSWNPSVVSSRGYIESLLIGDGRNDGQMQVYVQVYANGGVHECRWTGTGWSELTIMGSDATRYPAIGPGRNDGINRLYIPQSFSTLLEYTWNGSSYTGGTIPISFGEIGMVCVGRGRGDGTNRVYVTQVGNFKELTYTGSWASSNGGNGSVFSICVGKLQADGKDRVYSRNTSDNVYECAWSGSSWNTDNIDAITRASIAIGEGRNDDTMRMYVAAGTNSSDPLYEITNTNPYVIDTTGVEEDRGQKAKIRNLSYPIY
ncbi:MAG: hypothetical protein HY769_01060 [Candidatus Stahlbacteria bacterium]|nr:hypothetical protein [Candidatus Stahlbacteria bacterium]